MKPNLNCLSTLLLAFFTAFTAYSQSVPFPTNPPSGEIGPWGYEQKGTNWDTSPFLPFKYEGTAFRFMPPNGVTYDVSSNAWNYSEPGKKYPIILFFHGKGEAGQDNNNQLKHGGRRHRDAVQSGEFPGYLLYPQNGTAQDMKGILDKMVEDGYPIDLSRVYVHGLSRGAKWGWDFTLSYPGYVAAFWPMSGINPRDYSEIIYTPIRIAQGGLDQNPTPSASMAQYEEIIGLGGHMEYFMLDNVGHGTWNYMYNRNDFFTWFLSQSINKIYAKYDYYEVCPEDPIDVVLGVNPGLDAYEWRKDGILLDGEIAHELNVTDFGDYTVRVMINGNWTEWSEPKTVGERPPTQTPPIAPLSSASKVLPDPNGSTAIELTLPDGYEQYAWYQDGVLVGSAQTFDATPGIYTALVQERFGCSSEFSDPFIVLSNTGVDVPTMPSGLTVETLSKTSLHVNWQDPADNFDGIELYVRTSIDEPYTLVSVFGIGVESYLHEGLKPGTSYFYSLRAINSNGASQLSSEVEGVTDRDEITPTPPLNLVLTQVNNYSVGLEWEESTDDVGVLRYDVFQDGVRVMTSNETNAVVYNLIEGDIYEFRVRAVDLAGNYSPFSERVIVSPVNSGLNYKYYEGSWSALPDFNALTPVSQGISDNVDISYRLQNDNFGFLWEGKINIPVAGNYTFETYSDDGSKLYIGGYDESYLVVNNDGLHGSQYREGTYYFAAPGSYNIAITFFERGGGENMRVYWKNTAHGIGSRQLIPSEAFSDEMIIPDESVASPSALSGVANSTSEIALSWEDNSSNEVNFQLYRADLPDLTFVPIALLPSNTTSYFDSGLDDDSEYMYKIVALGQYSQSSAALTVSPIHQLELDSELLDLSGNGVNTNTYGNVQFNSVDKIHGISSAQFDGSGSYLNIDNGNQYIHSEFTERSVAFWIKASSISGIQDIYDEGGSTNGMAVRINNGSVELAVQDNHNIVIVSGAISAEQWTHVGVVFDNGSLQLYLNGLLVGENTNVGYSDVSAHGDGGGLGSTNGSNAFDAVNNNYVGVIDDFFVFDVALDELEITALVDRVNDQTVTTVRTLALPQPSDPLANFSSEILSPTSVSFSWESADVLGYQVLRSNSEFSDYRMIAFLAPDDTTYTDASLDVHTDYYYYVRSRISTGYSESSDTLAVSIPNYVPVMTAIADTSIYYEDNYTLQLVATDAEGDPVSFSSANLPAFVQLNDMANNTAELVVVPGASDFGIYEDIEVIISDGYDQVSEFFSLEVVSNFAPVIDPVPTYSMSGGETLQVTLTGNDPNGDGLTWSIENLPSFGQIVSGVNSEQLVIEFNPDEVIDGGVHNIDILLQDDNVNNSLETSSSLELTVIPLDESYKVYISFGDGLIAPSPWNSFQYGFPADGRQFTDIVNDAGFALPIVINLDTRWNGSSNTGGVSNSIYIDDAGKSYFYTTESETMTISGLDPALTYNFDLYGSRSSGGDRTSVYTVGGQTGSLQAAGNTEDIVEIDGVSPNADGEVVMEVSIGASSSYAYINAMVIEVLTSTTGVAPLAPNDLTAEVNGGINLTWSDNSFNETGFDIYRSIGDNLDYVLIGSVAADAINFEDTEIIQEDSYYQVKAKNQYGESDFSNEVLVIYENRAPIITVSTDVSVVAAESSTFDINVVDPEGDSFDLEVTGLPEFASLVNVDANNWQILVASSVFDLGDYLIAFEAIDVNSNSVSASTNLHVVSVVYDTLLVNFGAKTDLLAPAPWNNLLGKPSGLSINDLLTTQGVSSGIGIELVTAWGSGTNAGATTGDDSGVYPDIVMENFLADNTTGNTDLMLTGLDTEKVYDLIFFGSRAGIASRVTEYIVGGETVYLDVADNLENTVSINGVSPNSSGEIVFSVNKGSASYKYLNALEVRAYSSPLFPLAPEGLTAEAISKNSIRLNWADMSSNEEGFELYYSSSESGPWSLLSDLPANTTEYMHNGLSRDETVYYRLRAYNDASPSLYSEIVGETTYNYMVYINIGADTHVAPFPWNNMVTGEGPFVGDIASDFTNDEGNGTGIDLEIVENSTFTTFAGANRSDTGGTTTGDNSGVYPDVVLESYYWIEGLETATMVLSDLALNQEYDLEFFASRNRTDELITQFTVNGETESLNVSQNTSNTVTITDVVAELDGTVQIDILSPDKWGYIGAIVIKASTLSNPGAREIRGEYEELVNSIEAYPNPFNGSLNIELSRNQAEEVSFRLYTQTGQLVLSEDHYLDFGNNKLEFDTSSLDRGFYILNCISLKSGKVETIKLLK